MNEETSIATCDVLLDFGFEPDADPMYGLSFDFGNFKLRATSLINRHFQAVVSFTGVLATPRTVTEVEFEMLPRVASREECAAWIVWHLDEAAKRKVFTPDRAVDWLAEGRNYTNLLPWVRERAERERRQEEYRKRPHCTVQREWLKLALKTLVEYLADVKDIEPVEIGFDGEVLSFRLAGNLVVLAAQGVAWMSQFALPAGNLRDLPKRLMKSYVDVSVWRSQLKIDRSTYDGLVEKS